MTGRVLALLLFLLLPLTAQGAPELSGVAFDQHPGNQLPMDLPLREASGRMVRLTDAIAGRPAILVLGYLHCPNLCGIVRDDILHALSQSGLRPDQYSLLVVSIDPAETPTDAAAAQRDDMARYPLASAETWHYLTGPANSLHAIADAVGFRYRYDPLLRQFMHPAGLVFLNEAGRVSGYQLGVGYRPADVASGVARASKGEIQQTATPILLLCFHFDPATGRYTLAITKVVQLAGLLTVLTLGGLIGLALHRERPK